MIALGPPRSLLLHSTRLYRVCIFCANISHPQVGGRRAPHLSHAIIHLIHLIGLNTTRNAMQHNSWCEWIRIRLAATHKRRATKFKRLRSHFENQSHRRLPRQRVQPSNIPIEQKFVESQHSVASGRAHRVHFPNTKFHPSLSSVDCNSINSIQSNKSREARENDSRNYWEKGTSTTLDHTVIQSSHSRSARSTS